MFIPRRNQPNGRLTWTDVRAAAAGHPREREIVREYDPRPRSHPGWRQQRFENSMPTFATALPLPDWMHPEESGLLADRSASAVDGVIARQLLLSIYSAIAQLPSATRAVLCTDGSSVAAVGAAAGFRSERTAQRHRRSAMATLAAAGFSEDEVLAALPYFPVLEGQVMTHAHPVDRITRAMTREEHEDWRLGWPKNRLALRFARAPHATRQAPAVALDAKEAA